MSVKKRKYSKSKTQIYLLPTKTMNGKSECVIVIFGIKVQHEVKLFNKSLIMQWTLHFFVILVRLSKKAEVGC